MTLMKLWSCCLKLACFRERSETMKRFYRNIGEITIHIWIDDDIWLRAGTEIGFLLRTYCPDDNENQMNVLGYTYYIHDKGNESKINCERHYDCDINAKDWMFNLINDLETFYSDVLKCTTIHGSCIRVKGKTILLVGERYSGKTTLTHYFTVGMEEEYLSDDCVYLVNDHCLGFAMPLPMRELQEEYGEKKYFTQTIDSDGVLRSLYIPPKYVKQLPQVNYIIFPKYARDGKNEIRIIPKGEAFKQLTHNVRGHGEFRRVFEDVKAMVLNAECYMANYTSCTMLYDLLLQRGMIS